MIKLAWMKYTFCNILIIQFCRNNIIASTNFFHKNQLLTIMHKVNKRIFEKENLLFASF